MNANSALAAKLAAKLSPSGEKKATEVSKQFAFKVTPAESAAFKALCPAGTEGAFGRALVSAYGSNPAFRTQALAAFGLKPAPVPAEKK